MIPIAAIVIPAAIQLSAADIAATPSDQPGYLLSSLGLGCWSRRYIVLPCGKLLPWARVMPKVAVFKREEPGWQDLGERSHDYKCRIVKEGINYDLDKWANDLF